MVAYLFNQYKQIINFKVKFFCVPVELFALCCTLVLRLEFDCHPRDFKILNIRRVMSKRRHYSENFNSDDYPTDVLTYIPKDWKTPISEMKSKYKMPGGKPRNYQYRNSETNLILQDLYQQQENIRFNDPNGTKHLYLNLNPLMVSEYMDQYKTRKASDSEFYQRPPNMSSYYPAAMEDYNEPVSYWNPNGYASQFGRCCCFTRPIEDN